MASLSTGGSAASGGGEATASTPSAPSPFKKFPLIRQISDLAKEEKCPICFEGVGGKKSHLEELRLGCRCAIHYECLILYFRSNLKDRNEIRTDAFELQGILCPYKSKCKALESQIKSTSESVVAAVFLAASVVDSDPSSPSTHSSHANSIYCMTVEDMDTVVDYGLVEDAVDETKKHLDPTLLKRLEDVGCDPLSHREVADLRVWIQEKKQGVVAIDPNALDPYVKATTKGCPTCGYRSSHYHGHQCHHISPTTRGCPHCHVSYCYKCLSTEKENLKIRGSNNVCKCGYWSNFCITLTSKADVISHIVVENGIPKDKRCGCSFCPDCRFKKPCAICSGDCSVCRGVVKPGPLSMGEPWELEWMPPAVNEKAHDAESTKHRLWECCRQGDLPGMMAHLTYNDPSYGPGGGILHFINSQDTEGKTPLILACENSHHLCVRALIGVANVNANLPDNARRTPLFYASTNGFSECITELFTVANLDVNLGSNFGHTPLYQASRYNRSACVGLLAGHPNINPNATGNMLGSPLHVAAFHGNSECVRLLCQHKATNVNFIDVRGRSSLLWACYYGFSEIVKTLLTRKDVNLDIEDQEKSTALYWAIRFSHQTCVNLIDAKIKIDEPQNITFEHPNFLFDACKKGDIRGISQFEEESTGAKLLGRLNDINAFDRFGKTPFIYAVENDRIELVSAFLNCEVFAASAKSKPSKRAVITEQIKSLELQIANTPKDHDGVLIDSLEFQLTNLKSAYEELEEDLISDGSAGTANVEVRSLIDFNKGDKVNQYTALHYAICLGKIKMAELLLGNRNIDINKVTSNDYAAIHMSLSFSKHEIIKPLCSRPDIDLLLLDYEGKDAYDLLQENKYKSWYHDIHSTLKPLHDAQMKLFAGAPESRKGFFQRQCLVGHKLELLADSHDVYTSGWNCESKVEARSCKSECGNFTKTTVRTSNGGSNLLFTRRDKVIAYGCDTCFMKDKMMVCTYCSPCHEARIAEAEKLYFMKRNLTYESTTKSYGGSSNNDSIISVAKMGGGSNSSKNSDGSSSSSSGSSSSVAKDTWACGACTFENRIGERQCEICGTAAGTNNPSTNLAAASSSSSSSSSSAKDSWACGACTFENRIGEFQCEICGTAAANSRDIGTNNPSTNLPSTPVSPHPGSISNNSNGNNNSNNTPFAHTSGSCVVSAMDNRLGAIEGTQLNTRLNEMVHNPRDPQGVIRGSAVVLNSGHKVQLDEFRKYAAKAGMEPEAFLQLHVERPVEVLEDGREIYSYQELLRRRICMDYGGLNPSELELHLIESDFVTVFKMSKEDYRRNCKPWKQMQIKKEALLF